MSAHVFNGPGACLACLYLPDGPSDSQDTLVANALGVPDQRMQVRELLFRDAGTPRPLLELIAQRLSVLLDAVLRFEGRSVRSLSVEGVCGGAVLPLGVAGSPSGESGVPVPLAHQSALAGLLAAARLARGPEPDGRTLVTRTDVMRPVTRLTMQPVLKDARDRCICADADYQRAYRSKFALLEGSRRVLGGGESLGWDGQGT